MYKEALENFEELMKVASKEEIEAVATEILEEIEKEAKDTWKPAMLRTNKEFKEHGGQGPKEVWKNTSSPTLKRQGAGTALGAGLGALIAAKKGNSKAVGAAIGGYAGLLGGTGASVPKMVNQYKNDKAAIKGMIKSRLGEGATDEQVDKAYKKWILTGIFPAKPKTEKTASELLDEMVKEANIKK